MRRPAALLFAGCALALIGLMLAACGATPVQEKAMADATAFTDFATLRPPASPNRWLVAPEGFMAAPADEAAPVFDVTAERLAAFWAEIVEAQPRTRILGISENGLQIEAAQRSAVFGFTDRVSACILPLDGGRSTLAVYSRAEVGYWDLGVNRRRLRSWLAELRVRAAAG